MSLAERMRFLWNATGFVKSLIEEWSPGKCSSERECEESLYAYLHERLRDTQVVRQYARAKAHVDLMIGDAVMVEIKFRLISPSEYQRLIGQLVEYKGWNRDLIIVLIGDTEPSLLKNLRRFVTKGFDGLTPLDKVAEIVEKRL